ncbi:MAG TPA: peptidoglycan-binding domain-containing protein, partial [Candidatus Paceibacterota bacterium]
MKKPLQFLLGLLLLPALAFAVNDVTLQTDTIINAGGINMVVTGSNATIDSITVDSASFSAQLSANATLKISSADRRALTVGLAGSVTSSEECNSTESIYTILNPSSGSQVSITVTPTSNTCTSAGGGPVGSGLGGGGGGGSFSPASPVQQTTPATPATPTVTPAIPATPSPAAQPSPVAQLVSPAFNRTLSVGMRHTDVKALQQLLNADSATKVSSTGAGSPGNETEYFGPATERAVKKFQEKNGLEPVGIVGPKTRAALNALSG